MTRQGQGWQADRCSHAHDLRQVVDFLFVFFVRAVLFLPCFGFFYIDELQSIVMLLRHFGEALFNVVELHAQRFRFLDRLIGLFAVALGIAFVLPPAGLH